MKKLIFYSLVVSIFIGACSGNGSTPPSQSNFVARLKRAHDTVSIFKNQPRLQERIITNMGKYIASNMDFKSWKFNVSEVSAREVLLRVPAGADTAGYNVNYRIALPAADPAITEALAKTKAGDEISIDGQIDMKNAEGRISMSGYFLTDSGKFINIMPTKIN